ncbi:MAG TPA: VWA domain-containing protein, partial [Terriglobales bacterium]|nr:VWA domain-containing protein [Terriglobales bacterium]
MVAAPTFMTFDTVVSRSPRKCWHLWILSAILLFASPGARGQQSPSPTEVAPSASINLSETGYREPSLQDRLVDDVNESLDFLDDSHLLLTFDPKELFHRRPDCPIDHDDRLMRALVIEVPSGQVVNQATWYLHDHHRYIWPLGSGEFLLRRLNTLYLVDSSFHERELLQSPRELLWVSVTPDRQQIVVETREQPPQGSSGQEGKGKFVLQFLDRKTLTVQRTATTRFLVRLDGSSKGYADSLHKDDLWLIRFGSSPGDRRNIARVRAKGVPRVLYSSNNSLLIGRCCSAEGDYSVSSFTLSGHRLWREHWPQYRHLPVIAHSRDGGRFAVSTIIAKQQTPEDPAKEIDDYDPNASLSQNVQVIESATGSILRSLSVNPIVISEQNFSLSPDGRRLAMLSNSAIEIYDLPDITSDEQARLAALNANAPDLSAPVSSRADELASVSGPVAEQAPPQPHAAEPPAPLPAVQPSTGAVVDTHRATFRAAARAVVVDVVVTDAKGHPIKGLRRDDFEITEDGKEQDIRTFRESAESQSLSQDLPSKSTKQPPNVFTNSPATSTEPGSVMMILLDLLNTPLADQQYAREELAKFLKDRATNTSQFALAVMTANPKAPLKLVQGFTPDENILLAALNQGKGLPATAGWQAADKTSQDSVRKVRELTRGDSLYNSWQALLHGLEISQEVEQSMDTEARVRTTAATLVQLASYLAGIPGRKSLVWLSGSFPITLNAGPNPLTPATDNRSYARLVEQVSNILAQSQVAVYPVDVRGMDAASDLSASASSFAPLHASTPTVAITPFAEDTPISPYHQQTLQQMGARLDEHVALERIASATGGKAFFNANALQDAISTATEQASNYYSISYSPSNKNYDGRFRKIKITLPDKQVHLYYRPGYFADDSASAKDIARNIRVVAM